MGRRSHRMVIQLINMILKANLTADADVLI
jgi:hypothetical protein